MTRDPASLILLGYNNESFVGAAIAAAFAQTYENLEIILSDDSSADGTFKVMEEAAASYSGPHSIKLNKTPHNFGTLAHVYSAVECSTGELIVLAAADDISYPWRVERLVKAWKKSGAQALFSAHDLIDEHGRVLARNHKYHEGAIEWTDYFADGRAIRGATSAYARSALAKIPRPKSFILFEDTFFSLMLQLRGGVIEFLDDPLVQYRIHADAITNADFAVMNSAEIIRRERQTQLYADSIVAILDEFNRNLGSHPAPRRLASDRRFYEFRTRWMEATFRERLKALLLARRQSHRRWLAARLFGPRVLTWLRIGRKKIWWTRPDRS